MVQVDFKIDNFRPWLGYLVGYSVGKWVTREYQIRYGRRVGNLAEYGGLALTAVGGAVQFLKDIPYEEDLKRVAGGVALTGLDEVFKTRLYGEPIAWFTDQNTLVVKGLGAFNSDVTKWVVIVDGETVTVSGVDGGTDRATLNLATTVSKGKHDVVITVEGARKAFSGKLFVP
jgi:uncharacterized protein YneR